MKSPKRNILGTKDYSLFDRGGHENRELDLRKHRRLEASMKRYGFLPCFPIACWRDKKGRLHVKDGQHRLAIAESLGIPVFYVVEVVDFDVAVINDTQKQWQLTDYARKWKNNSRNDYAEGLEFAEKHSLSISTAFSLLGGTTSFSNVEQAFKDGVFKVNDRSWAEAVASTRAPLIKLSPGIKSKRFDEACMAICRVKDFDVDRLVVNAGRCREKLVGYSTRDAYLQMLEEVYNFGRPKMVALKTLAIMAMRERNSVKKK